MRFFGFSWDGAEDLPITIYWKLIEQAMNIGMIGFGKFELLSEKDKMSQAIADLDRLKREGKWNPKKKK